MNKDKIRGMFLGVAIGDALGMPVETMSSEEILKRHGFITEYLDPQDHKWFSGKLKAGMWTDDTQLTLAIAESLIDKGQIDMDDLAQKHISAMKVTDVGWGGGTRHAVMRLGKGISWLESGIPEKPGHGCGNGVVMKLTPLAAYFLANQANNGNKLIDKIISLTCMTHNTAIAVAATLAHLNATAYCLNNSPDGFLGNVLTTAAYAGSIWAERQEDVKRFTHTQGDDKLSEKLELVWQMHWENESVTKIAQLFGGGTSYVYNSLPFSYAFFLRNPKSIHTLYEVVNAGGDTDSNGSIVGGMLGALNGESIFPRHLIDGLWQKERILATADRFCNVFNLGE